MIDGRALARDETPRRAIRQLHAKHVVGRRVAAQRSHGGTNSSDLHRRGEVVTRSTIAMRAAPFAAIAAGGLTAAPATAGNGLVGQ